ncbi:MAG: 2-C-methyl-D-erythritol 4-phosphate cytidylyltransferase [Clostridiales bacterium]|nr:2-C-methyl-D-erythritol 4-phosphate cytidylyltransferase [Clostridiales bacterium]
MIFAAVFAGGSGLRMGGEIPKQYMDLCGKPVIIYTIEKFLSVPEVDKIIVLCPTDKTDYTKELIKKYIKKSDEISVTSGGTTRNDTLINALGFIEKNYGIDDESVILTHDAVRPFLTAEIIRDNIKYASLYGACDTAAPATDTIVESDENGFIKNIPVRKFMYQGQTPQSFNVKKLKETVESLTPEETALLTDACKIFTIKNLPVYIVKNDASTLQIPYSCDILKAEALLRAEENKKSE